MNRNSVRDVFIHYKTSDEISIKWVKLVLHLYFTDERILVYCKTRTWKYMYMYQGSKQ